MSILVTALKYGVVVTAVVYLITTGKLDPRQVTFVPERLGYFGLAILLVVAGVLLAFVRWYYLLRGVGAPLPLRSVVRLGFVGLFFNTFMFGAFGGDVIKLAYVVRETHRRGPAAASVLIDRLCGLTGLLLVGGLVTIASWDAMQLPGLRLLSVILFSVLGGLGVCVICAFTSIAVNRATGLVIVLALLLGVCLLLSPARLAAQLGDLEMVFHIQAAFFGVVVAAVATCIVVPSLLPGRGLARLVGALPGGGAVMSFVAGFLAYRHEPHIAVGAMLLSAVIQSAILASLAAVSYAVGNAASVSQVFFAGPPAFIANVLPVPLGGLGVGETCFANVLALCRTPAGGAVTGGALVFLGHRIVLNLVSVLGGLPFYLRGKAEIQALQESELGVDAPLPKQGGAR